MAIGRSIGVFLGNSLFKATGLMSKKTILRKSAEIADETARRIIDNKLVDEKEISMILKKCLGKRADRVKLLTNKEAVIEEMLSGGNTRETCESFYDSVASLVLPRYEKGDVILNLRLEDLVQAKEELVNAVAHESEHALFETYSLVSRVKQLLLKIPYYKNKLAKAKELGDADLLTQRHNVAETILLQLTKTEDFVGLTTKTNNLKGLVEHSQQKSERGLRNSLIMSLYASGVIEPKSYQQTVKTCETLISTYKDEARAYLTGGKAEQNLYKLLGIETQGCATKSELKSYGYDLLVDILKKERKIARRNWFRKLCGLTPKTEHEDKVIKAINKIQIEKKRAKNEALLEQQAKNIEEFWQKAIDYAV